MKEPNRSQERNINDIIDYSKYAIEITKSLSYDEFVNDRKTYLATIRCIEVIGEAASELNEQTKSKYPGIEWSESVGMRAILIHHYQDVKNEILWETVKKSLPDLLKKMEMKEEIKPEIRKDNSRGM
jgi:uncharacterized protein with HEPN domain